MTSKDSSRERRVWEVVVKGKKKKEATVDPRGNSDL